MSQPWPLCQPYVHIKLYASKRRLHPSAECGPLLLPQLDMNGMWPSRDFIFRHEAKNLYQCSILANKILKFKFAMRDFSIRNEREDDVDKANDWSLLFYMIECRFLPWSFVTWNRRRLSSSCRTLPSTCDKVTE